MAMGPESSKLSMREIQVKSFIESQYPRPVSESQINSTVFPGMFFINNYIQRIISRLRKKGIPIETVGGRRGYTLKPE